MNGPHDVGGQMGFGPINPEPNEPVFHSEWERRAFGVTIAAGGMGHWSLDETRQARETRAPADYYSSSYYELFIKGLEVLLQRHGFLSPADLASGRAVDPTPIPRRVLRAETIPALLAKGTPYDRPVSRPPLFRVGQPVRTKNINPRGHTRLPRYARGKIGLVVGAHGGFVFPDASAQGRTDAAEHLYTILFAATELWGSDGDPLSDVSIDAWESYLEPA